MEAGLGSIPLTPPTPSEVGELGAATGFPAPQLDKVVRLLDLINDVAVHPYLGDRVALTGGTALNMFVLDAPRLSFDLDLNYIGSTDLDTMKAERPRFEATMYDLFDDHGLAVKAAPSSSVHAGGKWQLRYQTPWGQPAGLSVDVNYVRRVPLWAPTRRDSYRLGRWQATDVPVMDIHELAAGKLRAFYDRSLPRDLYDVGLIPHLPGLDPERLRTAFVVYGASARSDWREVCQTHPVVRASDLASQLGTALLDSEAVRTLPESVDDYRAELTAKAAPAQQMVLPHTRAEQRFLDLVIDHGHVAPELLTDNAALRQRIGAEPWLKWKAINVQQRTIQERSQDQPGKPPLYRSNPQPPSRTTQPNGGGR